MTDLGISAVLSPTADRAKKLPVPRQRLCFLHGGSSVVKEAVRIADF
jgi:hypothetical protein